MSMRCLVGLVTGALVAALPLGAVRQDPPAATGALSGVVLDAATKTPVAGAVVQLSSGAGAAGIQSRQLTDSKGRFAVANLPSGSSYTLTASKFGYLDGAYGRETMRSSLSLRDDEWLADLRILLWRPATITGVVVDESGEPVVGAFVRVIARTRFNGHDRLAAGPLTTTDDRGAYRIAGLLPGRYLVQVPSVQATVPTTAVSTTGRGLAGGPYTTVVAGSPNAGAPTPAATNEPARDVGQTTRLLLRDFPMPSSETGRPIAYAPTFFPGTATPMSAAVIELKYGDERTGVDIPLEPVSTWRISGVVEGPGEALDSLTLRLLPEGLESLGHGSETATALVASDGRFTFANVPNGTYTIDAPRVFSELILTPGLVGSQMSFGMSSSGFPSPPSGRAGWGTTTYGLDSAPPAVSFETKNFRGSPAGYFGQASITVSGRDEDDVVVRLQPTGTLSGRVTTEVDPGRPTPTTSPTTAIHLEPADGDPRLGRIQNERMGQSTTDVAFIGVLPGEYLLRGASSGWTIKSVSWRGRDYTDRPFDAAETTDIAGVNVTVTNAAPSLSGTVRDAQGPPAEAAFVICFPADRALWTGYGLASPRLRSTSTSRSGAFRFGSVPAGDYFVVAVDGPHADWHEPEFMQAAERVATRVSLAWGQTGTADLVLTGVK